MNWQQQRSQIEEILYLYFLNPSDRSRIRFKQFRLTPSLCQPTSARYTILENDFFSVIRI